MKCDSMEAIANEVLITDELQKMPEDVRTLLDEHTPIPLQVTLFEEHRTTGGVAKTWMLGGGLILGRHLDRLVRHGS